MEREEQPPEEISEMYRAKKGDTVLIKAKMRDFLSVQAAAQAPEMSIATEEVEEVRADMELTEKETKIQEAPVAARASKFIAETPTCLQPQGMLKISPT